MKMNAAEAAIARICSRRILASSGITTTTIVALNNYRFAFFCLTLNTVSEIPRLDFSSINDLDGAVCLFRDMVRMQPQPSVVDFTRLLNSVVKMKHHFAALKRFDEMREWDVPVNDYTMNILINCYCSLSRVDFGFSIFGSFFKRGYEPSVTTFTTLLKGLFLVEQVMEGEKLFKKLVWEKYCEPNNVMILTVMNGMCKAGETRKAHRLLWLLEEKGYKPDVLCYNTIVDRLCKDEKFDAALKLVSIMLEKGVWPNDVTYCTMIQGLCNFGRWEEAKDFLNEMQAMKVTPSLLTCNMFLHGLCKNRQMDEALLGLCDNGKLDVARNLFKELPSKRLEPNVQTFTIIIGAHCQKKLTEEAEHLFRKMQRMGCLPNSLTYNALIHSFLRRNQCNKAIRLLEEMTNRGFSPDSVTSFMLRRIS